MSAPASPFVPAVHELHERFLALLPRIELHAKIYFRHLKGADRKQEAAAEVVGITWCWYVRLAHRGKDASRFVSALVSFAARSVSSGRRVCGMEKAKDVLSPSAQRRHGFHVESLPATPHVAHENLYSTPRGQYMQDVYEERLQDNMITPVPDQAAFRIDFPAWLQTLTGRERRLIKAMAYNERTKDLSRQFEVSPARISQLRSEFRIDWNRFIADPGETVQADTPILV